jgi:uncharacterized Zn finger protein
MSGIDVVLPVRCEKCEAKYGMECAHSSGFGYMQAASFRCESCGHVNKLDAVPREAANPLSRARKSMGRKGQLL